MTSPNFIYDIPTRLLFGPGALDKLGEEKLPGKKGLLVMTGGKSAKATGAYDRLLAQLAKAGATVVEFPKVQANPLRPTVMEGAALAKAEGCDFIVALGGGSVMDAAKMIGVMARNPGDLWDYAFTATGGNKRYPNDPLPLVCVTTTAGTGSEIDDGAVISDDDRREKPGFMDRRQFPALSVVDPTLMLSVPAHLTAYQGFDALFHCVEGYLAGPRTLMSELYALAGVERIGANLARCVTPTPSAASSWPPARSPASTPSSTPSAPSTTPSPTAPASSWSPSPTTKPSSTKAPAPAASSAWPKPSAAPPPPAPRTSSTPSPPSKRPAVSTPSR